MAPIIPRVTVTYIDFEGEKASTAFWLNTDDTSTYADIFADAMAVVTTMDALTNCNRSKVTLSFDEFASNSPASKVAAYDNVEEKLHYVASANNGLAVKYEIPGPKPADFKSDTETIDAANTAIIAFAQSLVATDLGNGGYVSTNEGTRLAGLNFGYRARAKSRREKPGRYTAIG